MLSFLRSRARQSSPLLQSWKLGFPRALSTPAENYEYLNLQEVEKILTDVKAGDVKVIPVNEQCDWTDFMVIATGTSTWHVRNIAQALLYKVKQKQKWLDRKVLPSVQGEEGGKWVVIDAGKVIVHALDEKAREYYNLEGRWTSEFKTKVTIPNEVIVHALDEKAREYYNLEGCWTSEFKTKVTIPNEDLQKAFMKIRPKNNSKKKPVERRA